MAVTNGVNKDTVAVIAGALAAMGIGFHVSRQFVQRHARIGLTLPR